MEVEALLRSREQEVSSLDHRCQLCLTCFVLCCVCCDPAALYRPVLVRMQLAVRLVSQSSDMLTHMHSCAALAMTAGQGCTGHQGRAVQGTRAQHVQQQHRACITLAQLCIGLLRCT